LERDLSPSELENSDAVFITSTTRDLLPVREIDGEPISKNESTVSKLSNAFSRFREDYVASRRSVPVLRQPEYSSI
jgi:branched-subunit amino acid aminotransferase/4-amino-4-deoxychorismate lyase